MRIRHILVTGVFCALTTLAQAHDPNRALERWSEDLEQQSQIDQLTGAIDDLGDKLEDIERDLRHEQQEHDQDPD